MAEYSIHPYSVTQMNRPFFFIDKDQWKITWGENSRMSKWEQDFLNNIKTNYIDKNKKVSEAQKKIFDKLYNQAKKTSIMFEKRDYEKGQWVIIKGNPKDYGQIKKISADKQDYELRSPQGKMIKCKLKDIIKVFDFKEAYGNKDLIELKLMSVYKNLFR